MCCRSPLRPRSPYWVAAACKPSCTGAPIKYLKPPGKGQIVMYVTVFIRKRHCAAALRSGRGAHTFPHGKVCKRCLGGLNRCSRTGDVPLRTPALTGLPLRASHPAQQQPDKYRKPSGSLRQSINVGGSKGGASGTGVPVKPPLAAFCILLCGHKSMGPRGLSGKLTKLMSRTGMQKKTPKAATKNPPAHPVHSSNPINTVSHPPHNSYPPLNPCSSKTSVLPK